jgi:hypothetical protein
VEATFESADEKTVTLKKPNGKTIEVPLSKLCDADQGYLAENAASEDDSAEVDSGATTMRGLWRIGIPEDGFVWGEVNASPEEGGLVIDSICNKEGSSDYVHAILFSQKCSKQEERIQFAKEFIEEGVEGLVEQGFRNPKVTEPSQDKRKKDLYHFTISASTGGGVNVHTVGVVKFGETSLVITANSHSPDRAVELGRIVKTVKEFKGKDFQKALDTFRRFQATDLGLSIEVPLDLEHVSQDDTHIAFRSPGGAYIMIRAFEIDGEIDFDKTWLMMQRMAIGPDVKVTDEGKSKVDGAECSFQSYIKADGGEETWSSTWMVPNETRFYLVTGRCQKSKKATIGKALLESIKGIKLIADQAK